VTDESWDAVAASHLFSRSLNAASGLIFFVDAVGAGEVALLGEIELVFAAGEGVFARAAGELLLLGVGVEDRSVVMETLGSAVVGPDFSEGAAVGIGLVSS
jgi:hypothetical protein